MTDELLKDIYSGLDSLPRTIQKRTVYKAKLGNGQGVVKVANRPGFVYARLEQSSGSEVVTHVYAPGVRHVNDNPVEVEINRFGFYQTIGVDPVAGQAFWSDYGTGEGGPHAPSHGLMGDDPLWIDTRQLTLFLVHPTNPPSLSVDMEAGIFRNMAGDWVDFIGGTIDLTSFMPTNLNEQRLIIVGVDKTTEATTALAGTATVINNYQPETVPFSLSDIVTLLNTADPEFDPKMAVRLMYGQTLIQQWDCFFDCRLLSTEIPIILPEQGGSGVDASGYEGYIFYNGGTQYEVRIIGQQTSAPTANDDSGDGFNVGSEYYTNQSSWKCLDHTVGAAVWTSGVFYSAANVSNPPTDAELDTAFGTPASAGAGFTAIVNDNGADTNVYLVSSTGSSWFYTTMTQAT